MSEWDDIGRTDGPAAATGAGAGRQLPADCISGAEPATSRGRIARVVVIGAATQVLIAMLWITVRPGPIVVYAIYFCGYVLAALIAQRHLEGIARLAWATVGAFWAAIAFWISSIPFVLGSPSKSAVSGVYPLPGRPASALAAGDVLPLALSGIFVGVLVGLVGWAKWSMSETAKLQSEIAGAQLRSQRDVRADVPYPMGAPEGESDRAKWGPPISSHN